MSFPAASVNTPTNENCSHYMSITPKFLRSKPSLMTVLSHWIALAALAVLALAVDANAGVNWPDGQLLPTLSTPAPTQDVISLIGDYGYKANGPNESHLTG